MNPREAADLISSRSCLHTVTKSHPGDSVRRYFLPSIESFVPNGNVSDHTLRLCFLDHVVCVSLCLAHFTHLASSFGVYWDFTYKNCRQRRRHDKHTNTEFCRQHVRDLLCVRLFTGYFQKKFRVILVKYTNIQKRK